MSVNIKVGTLGPINFVPSLFGKQSQPLGNFLLGNRDTVPTAAQPGRATEPTADPVRPEGVESSANQRAVPVVAAPQGAAQPAPTPARAPSSTLPASVPPASAPQPVSLPPQLGWAFDSERRNSFFLEWRITDPAIAAALAKAQQTLVSLAKGDLVVLQSCAQDNLHITLNEMTITSEDELKRCAAVVNRWMEEAVPRLRAAHGGIPNAVLKGIKNFNDRVFFAPIEGDGLGFLEALFMELHEVLAREKFNVKRIKGGEFAAHITLAKLTPGKVSASNVHAAIAASGLGDTIFGMQVVTEVVFCVKRLKAEPTPPVLMAFDLAAL